MQEWKRKNPEKKNEKRLVGGARFLKHPKKGEKKFNDRGGGSPDGSCNAVRGGGEHIRERMSGGNDGWEEKDGGFSGIHSKGTGPRGKRCGRLETNAGKHGFSIPRGDKGGRAGIWENNAFRVRFGTEERREGLRNSSGGKFRNPSFWRKRPS